MQELILATRRYRRGLSWLSLITLFGAINFVLALTETPFYLIFSPFLPTLAYLLGSALAKALGESLLLTVGLFITFCLLLLWAVLRYGAGKGLRPLRIAIGYYTLDTVVLAAFSIGFDYTVGLVDILFHLLALVWLLSAARAGRLLKDTPVPTEEVLADMLGNLNPPPEGLALGTEIGDLAPDREDTASLRAAEKRGRVLLGSDVFDLGIRVVRSYALTELVVRGRVYAERRGTLELVYSLTATVEGHRITVRLSPGRFFGRMILLVDGRLAADIRRYL